ncbi:MAG: hypothetical protein JXA82_17425, partial [Sedimentisphaerales bacterium]|nr:hypothetical protein [Sedimentisphaerales bacterium]
MKTKQCSRILFLLSCFWLLFPVNMVLSKPIQYSLDEHGLRLEGVGPDNPIIYDNDWWFDTPDKNYLWGMASLGKADLRANIVSRDMWNWQNGYLYKLEQGMKDARKSIEIARRSGVRNIPDAIAGCDCAFERPQSGRIEDTPIIPSKGSDVIVAEAQKATVQKPLLIFVGGPLNTIANAVLIDPSIADRIVVFMTDLRGYNGKDPWANFIVAKRCKLINYGAHIWWPQRPEPPVMPLERFKELPDNEQTRDLYRIAKWFWDRSTKDQPDRDDGFADGAPIFLVFQPKSWLQVKRQKITGIFTVQDVSNQSDYDLLDARELDYEGMTEAFFSCLKQASIYTHSVEPANRKSNPQVKAVLDYFYSLSDKSDERILSGQFTNFGTGSNLRIMEQIHDITGQWPALMGTDYADFRRGSITTKVPNAAAIEYWKQGGLVHVMAHMYNPANPKGGGLRDKGVDIADLLKEGTDTHTRWMEQLDLIAEGLLELKEAGVVVLWRPFHEMNGGWFWWGAQKP